MRKPLFNYIKRKREKLDYSLTVFGFTTAIASAMLIQVFLCLISYGGMLVNSMPRADKGRTREVAEIVRLRRSAAVGRLILGVLNAPLEEIDPEHYVTKPRRELKAEVAALRSSMRGELRKFCQQNFVNVTPEQL